MEARGEREQGKAVNEGTADSFPMNSDNSVWILLLPVTVFVFFSLSSHIVLTYLVS
jgi:hypothetical protein